MYVTYDAGVSDDLTIDELARRAGTRTSTVRLYQTKGLLPPPEIDRLAQLWFKSSLTEHDQARLARMIQIAETGSDNVYVLDLDNQHCCLCSHDPAGLFEWLPSFDDLIRMALIDLSWSSYGWPDPEIADMATALKSELFNW